MKRDLDVTSAYDEFRSMVVRITRERVVPHAATIDREARPPLEAVAAFREAGLMGLPFPEALGGQDGDLMTQTIAVEEVSRGCASSGLTLMTGWAALDPLARFGSESLKAQILPSVASGEKIAGWCLTEPHGGSNVAGIKTRARLERGQWVIDGTKRFITNAGWAEWYLVLAKTDEKSMGIFMVHKDDPGIRFGKQEDKMGLRGSPTADVIFEDCRIPEDRVVGDAIGGYARMMVSLSISRPLIAAQALGIAQGALDEAVAYTKTRSPFGQPVSRYQLTRAMVADMAVKVEASRAVLYQAVQMIESDPEKARVFASMAKLLCSDTAMEVTTQAVQLHGGYGYLKDYPVERMMRDAKITQIYEGTNQIQRMIIAKHVYQD
ncbi:acyl-CoA dehydrogenase family protein [Variovorax sp. J22P168]|uniref:acyl-CoA dehydrogenase family protein n=1 Tax=Variovorax jilinensis TaxID=3053513 RepID=UPI002576AA46|nr:acyl-CoA dehydrogenase family protein [Variovorax sp. J22P168]MDM0014921.1 acyl-CoA dehydrogenase family protein [Variovorax sp. J22P168]